MPVYLYRREDGTTFEYRQKFTDEPLKCDPETGQSVVRVVQAPGIVFKGSGFYVNDSKDSSRKSVNGLSKSNGSDSKSSESDSKSSSAAKVESSAAAD